jgi:hypothetical protein
MILLYLLILLFILVVLRFFLSQEGFENVPLDPRVQSMYETFVKWYNPFLVNWEKAITTAVSLGIEQEPQASPDEDTPPSPPPPVTRIQMNTYIADLSSKQNKPFPSITDPLPNDIDIATLPTLLATLPKDTTPYQNALIWMNEQMGQSQQSLQAALQGIPPTIEGFESTCQEVSQCIANNPEFVAQVAKQLDAQKAQTQDAQQTELLSRLAPFLNNPQLTEASKTNQSMANQLSDVQKQAESGELYSKLNLPGIEPDVKPTIPSGGFALSDMKQKDPQQYNQLKDNYKQWADVKLLIEQINRAL